MKIFPSFDLPKDERSSYLLLTESVEQLIEEIIPQDILALCDDPQAFAKKLDSILPFIRWSRLQHGGNAFEMTILCQAQFSHGAGRFLSDALSRRLIPGKTVELGGSRTLSFFFSRTSAQEYLINQRFIVENDPASIELICKNLPILERELHLTLLSIFKARHFLSLHPGNQETKAAAWAEIQHLSAFEEMHQIISRLSAEKTMGEIRKHIAPIYLKRPKVFDRDIFEAIKPFTTMYNEKFVGNKNLHFISRLVCSHFYFKKLIEERSLNDPLSRQILIRLFRQKGIVGILIAINLFGENEVLKKHHLVEAFRNCLPEFEVIHDSFSMDASSDCRPIFYLEAKKNENSPISLHEISSLRENLPLELQQSIQSVVNPLFMLRNEEDHLRLIISLCRELRYVRDIPQIAISFEGQTIDELSFSVVLLRVQKKGCPPIKEMLACMSCKIHLRETKNMGLIRNKYPKEFVAFKASLSKRAFLRKDHSLDLPRARQELLSELKRLFKDVRDFNGGLLAKQIENLQHLKTLLGSPSQKDAFLLENYFFSIEPSIAQTSTRPSLLKTGFLTLLKLIKENALYEILLTHSGVSACFVHPSSEAKDQFISLIETARHSFPRICYSMVLIHDLYYLTVFLNTGDQKKQREFESLLRTYLSPKYCSPASMKTLF